MTLDYLRYYTTFADRCRIFNTCYKTYSTHVWKVLAANIKLKFIHFENRINFKVPDATSIQNNGHLTLSIDTTFCPINVKDESFYSAKHSANGVKYEVGTNLIDGEVMWVNGPFKGRMADINIYRNNLKNVQIKDGERFVADIAYHGEKEKLLTPHKEKIMFVNGKKEIFMEPIKKLENSFIKHHRIINENLFSVIKRFSFLEKEWLSSIDRHSQAFMFVVNLFNISVTLNRCPPNENETDESLEDGKDTPPISYEEFKNLSFPNTKSYK
ncbi:hypothetical protein CYY_006181 [Polysphondylium violaceum]|uniref:DDE Tnp4 domain-containing protein n=1 Tax=Polysphondylium violaceum TaxID=133409 RepID=A0A8J4PTZ3_9MYCE|nr:hypothetical protein CYY_006181 [Polysphondylium violaceum]